MVAIIRHCLFENCFNDAYRKLSGSRISECPVNVFIAARLPEAQHGKGKNGDGVHGGAGTIQASSSVRLSPLMPLI
jgi:hypothetical protein